jgi:hypothetical protein
MTETQGFRRNVRAVWLSAWPIWTLVGFVGLGVARFLPAGYARAVLAAPILLLVPGSLTLGAVFSGRRRPQATVFVCYAILLSGLWSVFVSLALYAASVRISASSTYMGLVVVSVVVAVVAQARLLLGRPGRGRRAAYKRETPDPDLSDDEVVHSGAPAIVKAKGRYTVLAVVAGACLLAGGVFAYEHFSQPVPTGYTWMAWTGPRVNGDITIGSAGKELNFQIVHRQFSTTTFRLSATWAGAPPRMLAKSLTLRIGPNRTFKGRLFVPPLPDGCTYRIVVALTDVRHISPPTHKTGIWSINADVHDPVKSSKKCH